MTTEAIPTPADCPSECSFRILSYPEGLWQCAACGQLWDRPDAGIRTWNPDQQAEHQELWAQALESDRYRQGQTHLRTQDPKGGSDLFCCLGVATDICPFSQWVRTEQAHYEASSASDLRNALSLTITVQNWLGINSEDGNFSPSRKDLPDSLMAINDQAELDFKQIATLIRSKPPGMFQHPS